MSQRQIKIIVFPGGFNLPLWAGLAHGYFEDSGVAVDVHMTGSSVEQMKGLIEGKYELALTGFDNIVAYQEGQGEAQLTTEPDVFAFMGGDSAFLNLAVTSHVHSYSDLRGNVLAVDALTTGFAFVLRKMLALHGISEDDVTFERMGGVLQRFDGLKQGKCAGTLLLTPFEIMAEQAGCKVLESASAAIPAYQGVVGAARREWAKQNEDTLFRFIAAYRQSLRWLYDPGNRDSAVKILIDKIPNMSEPLARKALDVFLDEVRGFDPKAKLNFQGIQTVLELRSEYGIPKKKLENSSKYIDESYYQRAGPRSE
ncbi:MAG: ABC transporter substrate-binding protein [Xanthobacteraceae bacterium]